MFITARYSVKSFIRILLFVHNRHQAHFWIIGQFESDALLALTPYYLALDFAGRPAPDVDLAVFHHSRVHRQGIFIRTELYAVDIAIEVGEHCEFSRLFRP